MKFRFRLLTWFDCLGLGRKKRSRLHPWYRRGVFKNC